MAPKYNEQNALKIIAYFQAKGFNGYIISGILSNFTYESALEPTNAQNNVNKYMSDEEYTTRVDNNTYFCPIPGREGLRFWEDKVGYGFAQWTSAGRKTGLYNYCKSNGFSIGSLTAQLDYTYTELTTSYKKVLATMQTRTCAYDCGVDLVVGYEKPGSVLNPETAEATKQKRGTLAEEFYSKYFKTQSTNVTEIKEVTQVADKILALSAGHYLYTSGKKCLKSIDPTETREWVLNARVCDKLTEILNQYEGVKVL